MEYGIGELTALAGISARTLRYYDQIGLLKPLYVTDAGYRFYGEQEILLLQQILFYRERGFDLKKIRKLIYQKDFDIMQALKEHLSDLEKQKEHTEALIQTLKQTIASMKGVYSMDDKEKFRAFKEKIVEENEARYGLEIREKYGDQRIDETNQQLLRMTQEEWNSFQALEVEIIRQLEEAVSSQEKPEEEHGKKLVLLHRQWLCMTWKQYSTEAHRSLASMYLADKRFQAYYDRNLDGCTEFLVQAIHFWAERLPAVSA